MERRKRLRLPIHPRRWMICFSNWHFLERGLLPRGRELPYRGRASHLVAHSRARIEKVNILNGSLATEYSTGSPSGMPEHEIALMHKTGSSKPLRGRCKRYSHGAVQRNPFFPYYIQNRGFLDFATTINLGQDS